jgi:hypothetical protein
VSIADRRPLSDFVWFVIGVGGATVGLLPWLVTGARLPLQNLSADQSTTATPLALLPFSQYSLSTIVALLVVGAAAAGIAGRTLAHRRPRLGTTALVSGVLAAQALAAVQSCVVTVGLLQESSVAGTYAVAVIAVMIVSIGVGLLVLLLIARGPVPGATTALSLAAVVSANWIGAALRDAMMYGPNELVQGLSFVLRFLPAVLVGCAIAWCGFRSAGRLAAVVVSLAALWIGPAFFTAVSAAAGTRILAPYLSEMAAYGLQVFVSALTMPELAIPPLAVALVIGFAGWMLRSWRERGGRESADEVSVDPDTVQSR